MKSISLILFSIFCLEFAKMFKGKESYVSFARGLLVSIGVLSAILSIGLMIIGT